MGSQDFLLSFVNQRRYRARWVCSTFLPAYVSPASFLSPPAVIHRGAHEGLQYWHSGLGGGTQGGNQMDFYTLLDQVVDLLRQRQRMTYRALQRQFQLDDAALQDLKDELLYAHPEVRDDAGRCLVWTGAPRPHSRQDKLEIIEDEGILHESHHFP